MTVRFILGRAGYGKSHHGLEETRRLLHRDPLHGPPLLILVPEQSTLQVERALFSADLTATHRAEVFSFRRLAFRVLDACNHTVHALSEPARAMVLRHLLQRHRTALRYYRRVDRHPGFIARLAATITELIAEAVQPDDLLAAAAEPADDPRRGDKLHDLRVVYAAYLDYLGAQRVDPSQYFELAAARVPRCPWLRDARLFVDGFASFSRRETLLLVAVARACAAVEISLLLDPMLADPRSAAASAVVPAARLFRRTHETWRELHRACADAGLSVADPILLAPGPPPRFAASPVLAALERNLFAPQPPAAPSPPSSPASLQDVELIQWPAHRLEVQYAVACIQRWVSDQASPWRYRDIAILVRDLETYHDLLVSELAARHIPFFMDRRRPIAHHPLIELLRSAVLALSDRFSTDSARLLLKTGLLPVEPDAADELENYLLAHGLAGPDAWFGTHWSHLRRDALVRRAAADHADPADALARVNAARHSFADAMRPFAPLAAGAALTGAEWSALFRQWLDLLHVERTIIRWIDAAESQGDFDLAAQHRQVLRDVPAFLDDLDFALADSVIPVEEFAGVLEQGLAGLTLGLTPPTLDQVLVGTVERSRQPPLKGVILLGFNAGQFPRTPVEDSMLNDDDRAALRARGLHVAPPARVRALDEALLVYIAMTRASHRLVVTCSATASDGSPLQPSPYVENLIRACPRLALAVRPDPVRSGETWNIQSRRDLVTRLALEWRTPPHPGRARNTARWNTLYQLVRPVLAADRAARFAFSALAPVPPVRMSSTGARALPVLEEAAPGVPVLRAGVSALESYAACPFQYFARHLLRLKPRQEAALAPVDVGQVRHAVLEEFFAQLIHADRSLADLSDADLDAVLQEGCRRAAARLAAATLSRGRDAHALRSTRRALLPLLHRQRELARLGRLRPRAVELPFGFGDDGLPALELSLGSGRPALRLRGFIDRVDLGVLGGEALAVVIDYKNTREKSLDFSRVLYGLMAQLPAYLLVLREHGRRLLRANESGAHAVRPVAALLVTLVQPCTRRDRPDVPLSATPDPDAREPAPGSSWKPRGLIDFDRRHALDANHDSGWSPGYQLYRNKEGGIGYVNQSDGVPSATFDGVLEHVKGQLVTLAGGILSGDFNVRPVRLGSFNPCAWCEMKSACRMEVGLTTIRYLDMINRSDALTAMCAKRAQNPS